MTQSKKKIPTFLFYDYETFGLNTFLDKPAQFACIRTDVDFNIIDKPQCFYCFPSDDYLPDPNSVLITKLTPQYTQKYGTNEYTFSKKIHDIFIESNTCIIGYNNINFDDEITRNLFYRNFFDPYEWSWKNGNSRWDLLNLLRACYALRPDGIKWPKNTLGLPSFKLSDLTKINNITHLTVHDAVSDVYATIQIAKLIKIKQPKFFDFFFKIRKKNQLYKFINLNKFTPIIYVSSCFGAIRNNISCILPIILDIDNSNILIAVDLFQNLEKLIQFSENIAIDDSSCIKKLFNLGIVLLYLNRCPILAPIQTIRKEDYHRLNFNIFSFDKKIKFIKKNHIFISKIRTIFSKEKNINKNLNVDLQIYNSFFNFYDKKIIKIIRNTEPVFLKNINYSFHDVRLKTLFFRYRARNFFNLLDYKEKKVWLKYCIKVFNPVFLKEYKKKITFLLNKYSDDIEKKILLEELLNYFFKKCAFFFDKNFNLN